MARADADGDTVSRGLLTTEERRFLKGEKDGEIENPDGYRYNLRSNFRQRMAKLERDLELLKDADEDDLVDEFYRRFTRVGQVERELKQELSDLRDQLENQDE